MSNLAPEKRAKSTNPKMNSEKGPDSFTDYYIPPKDRLGTKAEEDQRKK